MGNKRGISQAFNQQPDGLVLRRATVFDVFDISQVLIRSITELCRADHLGDPKAITLWTENKNPAAIRGWIDGGSHIWLAENTGQVAAVGGLLDTGVVTLLYVDPDHSRCGVGTALLRKLERELAATGCSNASLNATRTARDFYIARGWQPAGAPGEWNGIPQFPMRKSLHPTD